MGSGARRKISANAAKKSSPGRSVLLVLLHRDGADDGKFYRINTKIALCRLIRQEDMNAFQPDLLKIPTCKKDTTDEVLPFPGEGKKSKRRK